MATPHSPWKDLLFPRGPNLAQKPLYLVGTVRNKGFLNLFSVSVSVADQGEGPGWPAPPILGKKRRNHRRKKSRQGKHPPSPPLAQGLDPPLCMYQIQIRKLT